MTEDSNGNVTFTVKELLARIDTKIDRLTLDLDRKASQSSVDQLAQSLRDMEARVSSVETDVDALRVSRTQLWTVLSVIAFVLPLGVAVALHYLP